jgi:hypothetical protein
MSNRQATISSTTKKLAKQQQQPAKKPPPKLQALPPSPNPMVNAQRAKPKNKSSGQKEKKKDKLQWWEHAGPLIDSLGGKLMSSVLPLIAGFGDYEVNTNSILASASEGQQGSTVPMMMNSKHANTIRHREYIGDILSSTAEFSLQQFPINPGNDKTFPWLYTTALCFSNYRMRGLVFEFVSTASNVSTTPALGFVAMATQYNSLDPVYTNKRAMDNSEYANSAAPTKSFAHPVECDPSQLALKELYVRHEASPSGDLRLYDLGRFSIAVGGQTVANQVIGELWATYEVELYFPLLPNQSSFVTNMLYGRCNLGAGQTLMLGNLATMVYDASNTFALVSLTTTTSSIVLTFPEECLGQSYTAYFRWSVFFPGAPNTPAFTYVGTNGTVVSATGQSPLSGIVGPTSSWASVTFKCTGRNSILTMNSSIVSPWVSNISVDAAFDITIHQIPN